MEKIILSRSLEDEQNLLYKLLRETDYRSLMQHPDLNKLNILNYYTFSRTNVEKCKDYENSSIFVSAKYDRSEIEVSWNLDFDSKKISMSISWHPGHEPSDKTESWEDALSEIIQNEVIHELINKILELK